MSRALGVYVHTSSYDFSVLDIWAVLVGRRPPFGITYQMFDTSGDGWQWPSGGSMASLDGFTGKGMMNLLTWQPFDWNSAYLPQSEYALSTILAGNHNTYIDTWIAGAVAYAKPVYIRFAHEFNGNWYPWCVGVNSNTSAQYAQAWRYIVDRFRAGGATNVRWIWSPNTPNGANGNVNLYPLDAASYPGDAYVDLIGLDGYNYGTFDWGGGNVGLWQTFTDIFAVAYDWCVALAPNKPIYIAETSCNETGGDKAAWITSAFLTEIPTRFPKLTAVVWFSKDNSPAEPNWRVDTSAPALAAYQGVVADSGWKGGLPFYGIGPHGR